MAPGSGLGLIDAALYAGMDPTGVADCTEPLQQAINDAAANAKPLTVWLRTGVYQTSAPLTLPPYVGFTGPVGTSQVTQADGGAVIRPSAAFSSVLPVTSVIALLSQTAGGYATVSEEQKIASLMIDGSRLPAGVAGIASYGKVQRVQLDRVLISGVTGDGIQHNLDGGGNQPDAWNGFKVFSRFCGGKGFNLRSADSTWLNCLGSNNGDASCDWFINTTSNSKYIGCRSEHSVSGLGFGYVCTNSAQSSGGVLFQGCSTDQSNLHGMQIGGTINGVASFVHAVALTLVGCVFRRDGANGGSGGGSYAGLYIDGYGGQVTIAGLTVWPGVNDDGTGTNSPEYGMSVVSGSLVDISGAYVQGATQAISDDGSNTVNSVNVVPATGTTGSPVIGSPVLSVAGNALSQVQPRTHGLVAWTFDPAQAGGNLALTNGAQYLQAIYPSRTVDITTIWFYVSTAAGAATSGECLFGIVDSSGNLLASVDVSALLTSTGLKQATISSTLLTAGNFYWIVAMANCSGSPSTVTLRATSLSNIALANAGLAAATNRFTGCGTVQTSLGNFPITPADNVVIASQQPLWMAVS